MDRRDLGLESADRAVAVIGVAAILPDALDAATFWQNVVTGRNSISEVTPDRWRVEDHFDPDPTVPDKTYTTLGGFVRGFSFDSLGFRLPPRVSAAMDETQKWALVAARAALADAGHPDAHLDPERTAVILGAAIGGELAEQTRLRTQLPETLRFLEATPAFQALSADVRQHIRAQYLEEAGRVLPSICEDSMPGELSNVIAGRVANALDLKGANFTVDAACASSLAAIQTAIDGLNAGLYDTVLTGGVDRNMGPAMYIKFSKIGALSKDGSRPFDANANGFVMGEGCVILVLRRLVDAERDGNRIYAVIRGVGASSDGRGKGITAPNPVGQLLALRRALERACVSPRSIGLIEAHGTSTRVGDSIEAQCLADVFSGTGLPSGSIALGSVKSQIGHLKSAAGAVGMLKSILALHHRILPPTIHVQQPNPAIPFDRLPLFLNLEARPWEPLTGLRRAGVSSFGFGGTNFHVILEEFVPGLLSHSWGTQGTRKEGTAPMTSTPRPASPAPATHPVVSSGPDVKVVTPRGILALGAPDGVNLRRKLVEALDKARGGLLPPRSLPSPEVVASPERLVIDFHDAAELEERGMRALVALERDEAPAWKLLRARGIFRGRGPAPRVAFLFPGQGSQYVGMLKQLREQEPVVRETFDEADRVLADLLPRKLSEYIFAEGDKEKDDKALRDTAVCQPAVLTVDVALLRLLDKYGVRPDFTMGHSLGEYAALVATSAMPLHDALLATSIRSRQMLAGCQDDKGLMASIFAPETEVRRVLSGLSGYVVPANINSRSQTVIGGATDAVKAAIEAFTALGINAVPLAVSHAFHTKIVASASEPLRKALSELRLQPPAVPLISNVTAEPYPTHARAREEILDLLGQQVASPVRFAEGLERLYALGARVFVEVGPKKVLATFVEDVLADKPGVQAFFTNNPKKGELESISEAVCGLLAAGLGPRGESTTMDFYERRAAQPRHVVEVAASARRHPAAAAVQEHVQAGPAVPGGEMAAGHGGARETIRQESLAHQAVAGTQLEQASSPSAPSHAPVGVGPAGFSAPLPEAGLVGAPLAAGGEAGYLALGRLFAGLMSEGLKTYQQYFGGASSPQPVASTSVSPTPAAGPAPVASRSEGVTSSSAIQPSPSSPVSGSVVITGAAVGLPGRNRRVFDEGNFDAMLRGDSFIESLTERQRQQMVEKRVIRLVKGTDGNASLDAITSPDEVLKLAGFRGKLSLEEEFGLEPERTEVYDITTRLAVGGALLALRDAGIPLVRRYRQTSRGTRLPDRWVLPESLAEETGVVFASVFPGYDAMVRELNGFHQDRQLRDRLDELLALQAQAPEGIKGLFAGRIEAVKKALETQEFNFDRKFLFHVLAMGHSQLAELIGAKGPNTQVNAACASACQALSVASDWIRLGRCRRVVVVTADDITSERLLEWMGTGFLASGAATTEADVTLAALPFDRRRNGMIPGMGVGALVVEAEDAVRERGMRGIAALLETEIANSAFHGTRLDVDHIARVMDRMVSRAEQRHGLRRELMAPNTVFVSHETYTPARGGSAAAEITSLRRVFGDKANQLVIANTKGMTGHAMGGGVEEAVAVKILETGMVPPVVNLKEPDPELGDLRLSKGGAYPVRFALRFGAGFGSQLAIALMQKVEGPRMRDGGQYQAWLEAQAGRPGARLEVSHQVLRIKDEGPPPGTPATSSWTPGTGPQLKAELSDLASSGASASGVAGSGPVVSGPQVSLPSPSVPAPAAVSGGAVVTAPTPSAPVSPLPTAPSATSGDAVRDTVLEVVANRTGYPPEMLELDLDLEADLGIDTVKQAEVFADVRGAFGIPRRENMKLRDYPTLGHLIRLVKELRPELVVAPVTAGGTASAGSTVAAPAASGAPVSAVTTPGSAAGGADAIRTTVLDVVAKRTGYPPEMLELDLDLEADLGIDTVKQAEVFADVRGAFGIPRRENLKLRDYPTLGHLIKLVKELRPELVTASPDPVGTPVVVSGVAPVSLVPAGGSAAAGADAIRETVLGVVAKRTGYPPEMLELDLDLEADLGIDTVKQAEVFADVRGAFGIPRRENLKLRDYPTLGHLIKLVKELRPELAGGPAPASGGGAPASVSSVGVASVAPASGSQPTATAAPVSPLPTAGSEVKAGPGARASDSGPDVIRETVLGVVARRTGYPPDMLELDLDLEADLGIDTVKQAEVFADVRGAFGIPRRENLKLRDYPTLGHLIKLVKELRPELAAVHDGSAVQAAQAVEATHQALSLPPLNEVVPRWDEARTGKARDAVQAPPVHPVPRRFVVPVLRPDLELCQLTGAHLAAGARVVVVADQGGVSEKLGERLANLGIKALYLTEEAIEPQVEAFLASGPVDGVYFLPALDVVPGLLTAPAETVLQALEAKVRRLYRLARGLLPALKVPGAFLVAGTRLGGLHGYGPVSPTDPTGGAVSGFLKALARELPEAVIKAVDVAAEAEAEGVAEWLLEETVRDGGVVEVGYAFGARHGLALEEREEPPAEERYLLDASSLVLVTGAGGGITAGIVRELAAWSRATFCLVDVGAAPEPGNPDLARLVRDREGLRQSLTEGLKAKGERVTPARLEQLLNGLERDAAMLALMADIEAMGGKAFYRSADVRDGAAVGAIVEELRAGFGKVDLVLHAAGLERSRLLEDKGPEEFDRVFDVKVLGLCHLMRTAEGMPVGALISFSSVAGRFGNGGQTDYSAANDFLCKATSCLLVSRPGLRALAIDWTAWAGAGMATRGSIPEMMRRAGIDMLELEAGLPIVGREVARGSMGELVVGKALGIMVAPKQEAGGLDVAAAQAELQKARWPMLSKVVGLDLYRGLEVQVTLDPAVTPFLTDHQIDQVPVLPGVMGLEGFAEVASLLMPGYVVQALERVQFEAPFKCYRHQPRTGVFRAQLLREAGERVRARVSFSSARALPGAEAPVESRHFSAEVVLGKNPLVSHGDIQGLETDPARVVKAEDLYRLYFHGPAYQVLSRVEGASRGVVGFWQGEVPPGLAVPAPQLVGPRLIELCFQTAGVWEIAQTGSMGLPSVIERVVVYGCPEERGGMRAEVLADGAGGYDAWVRDGAGQVVLEVRGYRTSVLPGALDEGLVKPLRAVLEGGVP